MVERWTGRETRALRRALRMTVQGFAEHLGVSPRTVSKWESRGADIEPLPELQAVLDTALKQSDDAARQRWQLAVGVDRASAPFGAPGDVSPSGHDEVERRVLLQALSVLGAVRPTVDAISRIRDSVDAVLGHDDTRHLSHWEEAMADYGYSYVLEPPEDLVRELAVDLVAVRTLLTRGVASDAQQRDWFRILAGLAMVMAKSLANLGHVREAQRWWMTAQHASEVSADTDLGLWVNAEKVFHAMYANRPATVLLASVDQLMAVYPGTPGRGLAPLRTGRAQLLAMLGRHVEALDELRAAEATFEQLPESITGGTESFAFWGADRLHYTATWIHAYAGDQVEFSRAAALAHAAVPSSTGRAHTQLQLLEAFGHVRAGDVQTGTTLAAGAYEGLSAQRRTTMVSGLAAMVLDAVPVARRSEPGVADYRDLLMGSA